MSDQDHPAWPTADDDVPPARPTPEEPGKPADSVDSSSGESTKRIQFPAVDPDAGRAPVQQTTPLAKAGYAPPDSGGDEPDQGESPAEKPEKPEKPEQAAADPDEPVRAAGDSPKPSAEATQPALVPVDPPVGPGEPSQVAKDSAGSDSDEVRGAGSAGPSAEATQPALVPLDPPAGSDEAKRVHPPAAGSDEVKRPAGSDEAGQAGEKRVDPPAAGSDGPVKDSAGSGSEEVRRMRPKRLDALQSGSGEPGQGRPGERTQAVPFRMDPPGPRPSKRLDERTRVVAFQPGAPVSQEPASDERTRSLPKRPERPAADERTRSVPFRMEPAATVTPNEPIRRAESAEDTVRAAPMRIEPAQTEEEAPPKRRRTGLLVAGAIALVVVVAAGVVFAVPSLRNRVFGQSEQEVAVQPPPAARAFTPTLNGPKSDAPSPSAQGVTAALAGPASAPALGTLTGTVVDPATGSVLWDQKASTALVPASTAKILTAAAALLKLDHGQQFVTKVVAGKDPGTVVLVGGGDPTISSLPAGKQSFYPGAAHLDDLVAQVKAHGKVTQVQMDLSRYTADGLAQGWVPSDVPDGYIAPPGPAMMDGGRADGTKDKSTRSMTPGRTLAGELAKRLGASLAAKPDVTAAPDAKVLGEVKSAPLTELVDTFLQTSDNVLAETVAREVAKAAGEEASFAGISKSTLKVLQENNFDISGSTLIDGSGLSTVDKVPARLLGQVLAIAAGPDGKDPRTAKLRPLLGGLPVAGGSGTLESRFPGGSAAATGRGWVRAKTGTLSGVNSLAGVVLDADGKLLVFALMTSGTDALPARAALDVVAAALRGCGCK